MPKPQNTILVQSIVSATTGEALVQIKGAAGQMTPAEARDLALNLLACAEAAETDMLLMRWIRERIDDSPRTAAALLNEIREMRGSAPPADWRKPKE